MHDSIQVNLPLEVLIQNDSRMSPCRVATFQCEECSFPSDTKKKSQCTVFVFVFYSISSS